MSTRAPALAAAVLAAVAISSSGCTPSHSEEAGELRDDLSELSGVADVDLDYVEPELLDQADVNLEVVMTDAASPEEVAAVFETAYAGLTDAHEDEEGNLSVRFDDDELELRTFESEADASDVAEAALAGAEVAEQYRRAWVQVMTQEVADHPHVESLALVQVPKGTKPIEVDEVRAAIAKVYGDLPVRVDVRVKGR